MKMVLSELPWQRCRTNLVPFALGGGVAVTACVGLRCGAGGANRRSGEDRRARRWSLDNQVTGEANGLVGDGGEAHAPRGGDGGLWAGGRVDWGQATANCVPTGVHSARQSATSLPMKMAKKNRYILEKRNHIPTTTHPFPGEIFIWRCITFDGFLESACGLIAVPHGTGNWGNDAD